MNAPGTPRVAVAISTLGRPSDLERCLESLLAGTERPAEVVIVDQSGDSATAVIVAAAADRGLTVRRIEQERHGLGAAQNVAVRGTTCRLVAVLDDDCVAASGWLAAVADVLDDGGHDVVTGPVLALEPDGERTEAVSTRTSLEPRSFGPKDAPWHVGSGNNFALRREWFDRVGGCDERLGPGSPGLGGVDMDLFYRLLRGGARVRYEPGAVVFHARTTVAGRRARRVPYGHGIGALCALRLREHDAGGLRVLLAWLALRFGRLARGLLRARLDRVGEEFLVLWGTARGLLYGMRV
jgi:GT2 family glycosyltransferase